MIYFLILLFSLQGKDIFAPNRPSQSNSPWVVPKNTFLLETGFDYSNSNNIENLSLGVTELRYAPLDKHEFKFGVGLTNQLENNDFQINHLSLNYKYELNDGGDVIPSIGVLTSVIASDILNDNTITPQLRFIFRHIISDLSISYNLGYIYHKEQSNLSYTFNLGYNINDRLAYFIEIYGNAIEIDDYLFKNYIDMGFAYLLKDTHQIDFHFGKSINENLDFYFINLGTAFYLNNN